MRQIVSIEALIAAHNATMTVPDGLTHAQYVARMVTATGLARRIALRLEHESSIAAACAWHDAADADAQLVRLAMAQDA